MTPRDDQWSGTDHDPDLAEVVRLERLLLDPSVRSDDDHVTRLLHPQFREHGASGRVWDRAAVVAAMSDDAAVAGPAEDFEATRLAGGVVLLTYRVPGGAGSLRSSVWLRAAGGGWQLRFHQGTRSAGRT